MTSRVDAEHHLAEWADAAWVTGDPEVLGRCAALMARTLGADPTGLPELPDAWWSSPAQLDARDRACLRFTEQWLLDVAGIDESHVNQLLTHFAAADVLGLLMSLVAIEQQMRVTVCLDRILGADAA